jgi:hypothetical protein
MIDSSRRHEWVALALGLDRYPILHRDIEQNPRTGAIWGAIRRIYRGDPVGRGVISSWPGSGP